MRNPFASRPAVGGDLVREVRDERGRSLPYVLRPAANPAEARTLVILHGRGANARPAKFVDPNWNVVCPLDRYGEAGRGCWWLGEDGDFFVAKLLRQVIREVRAEVGRGKGLYFWGTSMGGYGAILHGTLLRAHAVYAHIPQIRLRGTDYTDTSNKPHYDAVLGDLKKHPYMDLARLVAKKDPSTTPMYFLNQNRFDYEHYVQQHCLHFIGSCNEAGHAYSLNIDPYPGHRLYRNIADGVSLFDRFAPQIRRWRVKGSLK